MSAAEPSDADLDGLAHSVEAAEKAAAESAGGTVSVTSELGRGSRFVVDLPAC